MRPLVIGCLFLTATLVACEPSTDPRGPGSLWITSSTPVIEPSNLFVYTITVDRGTPREIFVFENDTLKLNGLAHGAHTVELSGLPSMCNAGALTRQVTLRGDDTARVEYTIQCTRTTGDVRVSVTTSGQDLDLDGYTVLVNQVARGIVPPNGQTTLQFLQPGNASISLSNVAPNCSPAAASQSVAVVAGVLATVNMTVTCSATANVRMVVTVTGSDVDPDGVTLKVGSGAAMRVAKGTSFVRVNPGTQTWELGDVQPNCTLAGASSGSYTAAAGDTTTITATLDCAAVGYGTATTVATDAAGDTLANSANNANAAHDVRQVTTRYAPGWLMLVTRYGRPVGAVGGFTGSALQGFIELDIDENLSTGVDPAVNAFGGNSQQGVDYGLILFEAVPGAVRLRKALGNDTTTHLVPLAIEGDSVVIRVPLAKLAGDDGNMSVTMVVGTNDRPTDLVPNSGVVLARQPSGAIVAADVPSSPPLAPKGKAVRGYTLKWPKH